MRAHSSELFSDGLHVVSCMRILDVNYRRSFEAVIDVILIITARAL